VGLGDVEGGGSHVDDNTKQVVCCSIVMPIHTASHNEWGTSRALGREGGWLVDVR
jgi:hypothetical protein